MDNSSSSSSESRTTVAGVNKKLNDALIYIEGRFGVINQRLDTLRRLHDEDKALSEERHRTLENLMTNVQNPPKESTQANQNMSNSNVDHKATQLKGNQMSSSASSLEHPGI
ncbi:hypothetical protein K3495_g1254 [Podosphaera aphanis]|nr:hypothetical protein K3495_g1254 [Podosphaera aphanis]